MGRLIGRLVSIRLRRHRKRRRVMLLTPCQTSAVQRLESAQRKGHASDQNKGNEQGDDHQFGAPENRSKHQMCTDGQNCLLERILEETLRDRNLLAGGGRTPLLSDRLPTEIASCFPPEQARLTKMNKGKSAFKANAILVAHRHRVVKAERTCGEPCISSADRREGAHKGECATS